MPRSVLYIDIEGFSTLYQYPGTEIRALKGMGILMEMIFKVGNSCLCSQSPNRLFAHQIGDGFLIVSEFQQANTQFSLAFAIAMLRSLLLCDTVGKCSVSIGEMEDVVSCFPNCVMNHRDGRNTVRLGEGGRLHILPVMGTALINSYQLNQSKSGSLLLVDRNFSSDLPEGIVVTMEHDHYWVIDWVHSCLPDLHRIENVSWKLPTCDDAQTRLNNYLLEHCSTLSNEWCDNTRQLNKLPDS